MSDELVDFARQQAQAKHPLPIYLWPPVTYDPPRAPDYTEDGLMRIEEGADANRQPTSG